MTDAPPIPRAFREKLRWMVDHHHWFFGLVAVEQLFTGHYLGAALAGVAWIADLYVASHWDDIVAILRGLGMMTFYLVLGLCGALAVGVAIGGWMSTRIQTEATASTGRITWNLEQAARSETIFLNTINPNNTGLKVVSFGFHGKNTSTDPISQFSGYIRSDLTNVQLPFYIMAQDANAPTNVFLPFTFVPTLPQETFGIPGLADFDIVTHNTAAIDIEKDGVQIAKFLHDFGAFTVVLEYDGKKIERRFSKQEVDKQIAFIEKTSNPQQSTAPRIIRRPNATPPIMPQMPLPLPAPENPAPTAK